VSETALCLNGLGHILGNAVNLFLCGFRSEVSHRAQFLVLCSLAFIYPLRLLLISLDLSYHFYAEDMQIYIQSKPGQFVDVSHLYNGISGIKLLTIFSI